MVGCEDFGVVDQEHEYSMYSTFGQLGFVGAGCYSRAESPYMTQKKRCTHVRSFGTTDIFVEVNF